MRQGKQTQCGAGDDPKAAFGTNKQAVQARASGRFFDRTRGDHLTGREHGFYSQHLISHCAIFSPQIPETIGANSPANSGDGDGPRIMAAHQPVGCCSLVQRLDGDPSTHIGHAIGWSDVDLLEPAQVEHQSWYKRCRSTHQSTAATYGNHRDTIHRREADHCRHLRGMLRTYHAQRFGDRPARHTPGMERVPR